MIGLEERITSALLAKSQEASSIFVAPKNSRGYGCKADKCSRPAYAKGYCNAHYIRLSKGMDMSAPIRARKRNGECSECGKKTGTKGGWGLCPKHYTQKRIAAIKDACIEALGGACARCKGVFHRSVFDFHHVSGKDHSVSYLISNSSPSKIAEEVSKCILLCANCHRLEHHCDDF